jgi:hypothetical protein
MSTVKITQLPSIAAINANTANTLFVGVDIPTGSTGKITAHSLAQGLYSNEVLNVGNNPNTLPNTVAQFASSGASYIQTNLVNTDDGGSADIVVTANVGSGGTDSAYFIDMGFANRLYQPGSEFNNIGTAINSRDGYLYVQGLNGSNGGNLIIGTTTTNTEMRIIVGGGTSSNIVGRITKDSFNLLKDTNVTGNVTVSSAYVFSDATRQTTAANTVFLQANDFTTLTAAKTYTDAANTVIQNQFVYISGVDTTQNTKIQSSFDKANNAIANTSGVITAGDFNIAGNLTTLGVGTAGLFTVNATSYVANTAAFKITGSANFVSQLPLNQGYMMHVTGFANTPTRIVSDAFGTAAYPVFVGRTARGTAAAPTASQNNDVLLRMSGNGWGATGYSQFGVGRIDIVADENYTDTVKGSKIEFWNTITGSNTLNKIATFNATKVSFLGYVVPEKGFVYAANTYPGAQTAIVIDFANNSVLRANTSAGLSISFANYTPGKVVELWVTNTAGSGQTFTHGCSAIASTVNATTYNIPSTSSILARYMCFGSDAANVLVSVVHS